MEKMYYYWLHNVSGIGRVTFRKILKHMTPKQLYECNLEVTKEFLTKSQRENIERSKCLWNLKKEWERIEKRQISLWYPKELNYPQKLLAISDRPPVIYQKGKKEVFELPSVAVIGARNCSNYGSFMAKELGKELAAAGIVVVSGMARGIDSICQMACLKQGGKSIGVLGCGVEVCYPPEHRNLYELLQLQGSIVSENPPFMQPSPGLFPLRNRIISGLADFVVVIEAREKSGTLITVDMALEQGKEVYAIPGRVTDATSRGCNQLIRQGAGMISSLEEFLEEICPLLKIKYQGKYEKTVPKLTTLEKSVLGVMDISFLSIDEIYEKVKQSQIQLSITELMETILELRMKAVVGEENGYYFQKN